MRGDHIVTWQVENVGFLKDKPKALHPFRVVTKGHIYLLAARSAALKQDWIKVSRIHSRDYKFSSSLTCFCLSHLCTLEVFSALTVPIREVFNNLVYVAQEDIILMVSLETSTICNLLLTIHIRHDAHGSKGILQW